MWASPQACPSSARAERHVPSRVNSPRAAAAVRTSSSGVSLAIDPALKVAPRRLPFVVLLGEDAADQAHHRGGVREDADHVGAALDLLVQPLERVVRPDLTPVPGGKRQIRQHVGFGVIQQLRQSRKAGSEAVGHPCATARAPRRHQVARTRSESWPRPSAAHSWAPGPTHRA